MQRRDSVDDPEVYPVKSELRFLSYWLSSRIGDVCRDKLEGLDRLVSNS